MQNTPSMEEPIWEKIVSGMAGSPTITLIIGCSARDWARGDEALRVRAKMWIGKEVEARRRAETTAPPCLPVAPTTRYFRVAIVFRSCSLGGDEVEAGGSIDCVKMALDC